MTEKQDMRLQSTADASAYRRINRQISKSQTCDLRHRAYQNAIGQNRGSKVFARDLSIGQSQKMRLKTNNGSLICLTQDLGQLKNGKAPGDDGITAELLKAVGKPILKVLQRLFDSVIHLGTTPEAWHRSMVVLFFKKGSFCIRTDIVTTRPIQLHRGVRQGDVISPMLFTAALEDVFKLLDWNGLSININGEYITQLRFADDVVIVAETLGDLNTMLSDLSVITAETTALEIIDEYVYLGHTIQLGRSNFEKEVNRRIQLGWAAFGRLRDIFRQKSLCLKTKVFERCVSPPPVMTYGSETRSQTMGLINGSVT
ncbi:jg25668 [Pararge aegeria aegeria]|uniref:Jg25668 protein n=1 Tax=Pararge aegeria aegeria TaxID=348720 RepID=A0A8S4QA88_9NEOP|nr:jg25668 [Pararge aegeria aegeria]